MTDSAEGHPAAVARCPNCGSDQVARYCAQCGQKGGSLQTPIGEVVREALDELFTFDSRIWRTLIALYRHPGSLTVHYREGRRARFVTPLRLYLFASFLAFLFLATVAPDLIFQSSAEAPQVMRDALEREGLDGDDFYIMIARRFVWRVPEDGIFGRTIRGVAGRDIEDPERVQALVMGRLAWTVFGFVPVFAVLLRLLYGRRELYFVPHFVFALHFHTLAFLLIAAGIGVGTLLGIRPTVAVLTLLAAVALLFPSLRRVYGEGRLRTIGKQVALLLAYGVVVSIGLIALVAVTGLTA